MIANVRARFSNGKLTPLEPLDLKEGEVVVMSIEEVGPSDKASKPALTGESLLEMFEKLRESVPPDAWKELPTDLAKNKKHYLYGFPKETD